MNSNISLSDKYQCIHCKEEYILDAFEDLECDGDIWGICPNCNHYGMVIKVYKDEEDLELFN